MTGLVPVTVLGGYLGAGKTTVLNRLLANPGGRRLAVLVNDFGAIEVDAALLESHQGQTMALTNGCVCCSIADALGDALDTVVAMAPDHIVIEASGVADPGQVAVYGQGWPGCRLDAVVVVADAATVRHQADDPFVGSLIQAQLRSADLVVATKTDTVTPTARTQVIEWLADRTGVPVVEAIHGALDPAVLLEPSVTVPVVAATPGPSARPDAPDTATPHLRFEQWTVEVSHPVTEGEVGALVDALPNRVVRVKGFVTRAPSGPDQSPWLLVQGVGPRLVVEPWWSDPGPAQGHLQVIARPAQAG